MKPTTVGNFKNAFESLAHDLSQTIILQINKQEAVLELVIVQIIFFQQYLVDN